MAYISPALQRHFESLSTELKNEILSKDVRLESLTDLIRVLEQVVEEA